jgi:hypothetical protein
MDTPRRKRTRETKTPTNRTRGAFLAQKQHKHAVAANAPKRARQEEMTAEADEH